MTREEQLRFCKVCKNQKFDIKQGIVCSLTNLPADFETRCDAFDEDLPLNVQFDLKARENQILRKTASLGKRFANYLLDFVFYLIFSFLCGIILAIVFALFLPEAFIIFEMENKLVEYFFGFVFGMIYYTTFEAFTGRTIAKYITRTKVVTVNGEKPDFMTIFIRSLCRFVPLDPLSFLLSDKTGWHDLWSDTVVVEI
jgi:uncharacterized RDD family membrane protein YckC